MKKIKQKDGYMSLEAIIVMSVLLLFIFLMIALFTFFYPTISISNDVFDLSKVAEARGGLSTEDVDNFIGRLKQQYSFVNNSDNSVQVFLEDIDGNSYLDITDENYVKYEENKTLKLTVLIPANIDFLNTVLLGFKIKETLGENYVFRYSVHSRRF